MRMDPACGRDSTGALSPSPDLSVGLTFLAVLVLIRTPVHERPLGFRSTEGGKMCEKLSVGY